jgi:hypothetical protein
VGAGTELWLVRHGETQWSAEGRHTSRTDLPLTERGRERAAALGKFLAGTKFAAVLRSPMRRARETCEIAGFGDVAVVDDGLREWDYGVYEGRTTDEIQAEIPGWSVWNDPIVGGETVEQVGARADGVIARALAAGLIRLQRTHISESRPFGRLRASCGAPRCRGECGAVWSCAYSADSGGAVDWAGGAGWGAVCAGDGERERAGVGAGDKR